MPRRAFIPRVISGRAGQLFTIFCIFLGPSETQLTPWKKIASHRAGTKGIGSNPPSLWHYLTHATTSPTYGLPGPLWA